MEWGRWDLPPVSLLDPVPDNLTDAMDNGLRIWQNGCLWHGRPLVQVSTDARLSVEGRKKRKLDVPAELPGQTVRQDPGSGVGKK